MCQVFVSSLLCSAPGGASRFVRVGTLVMMIHDISDVFLETAKLFNYASQARPWAQVSGKPVTEG